MYKGQVEVNALPLNRGVPAYTCRHICAGVYFYVPQICASVYIYVPHLCASAHQHVHEDSNHDRTPPYVKVTSQALVMAQRPLLEVLCKCLDLLVRSTLVAF